jgi:hypothetical protein
VDDTIIEVAWKGEIVWEWVCSDHFDEMDFSEEAKNILCRNPNWRPAGGGMGAWMHIDSMSLLGPSRWYDAGDERFHPDNLIRDGRETNIIAIIDKKTGKIVWKVGPDYDKTQEIRRGWTGGVFVEAFRGTLQIGFPWATRSGAPKRGGTVNGRFFR